MSKSLRSVRGDRRGHGRIRRCHSRLAAWQVGRGRRETECTRGHVSDLGMHPHQGAPRTRPRAEGDSTGRRVGRDAAARDTGHQHDAGACAQGQDRRRAHQGHRVPVQEEQDRLDQGHCATRRSGQESTSSMAISRCSRRRRSSSRLARRLAGCQRSRSITRASSRATRRST